MFNVFALEAATTGGGDLMGLGNIVKYHIQLFFGHNAGIGLGLFIKLGDDVADFLGGDTKVSCDLLQTILNKTHSINAPPYCEMQNAEFRMQNYCGVCFADDFESSPKGDTFILHSAFCILHLYSLFPKN